MGNEDTRDQKEDTFHDQEGRCRKGGPFRFICERGRKKRSDIDILIEYRKGAGKSLLDMVKLQFELEEILGRKVDLFTYDGIHSLIKDSILSHREVIYEKRK